MSIDNPSRQIVKAVENAAAWFNESAILHTRVKTISAPDTTFKFGYSKTDNIIVNNSAAPAIRTRYYELKTHRPIFCNWNSKVVYSLSEVERERRAGYGWYTYEPPNVLNNFASWQKKWAHK